MKHIQKLIPIAIQAVIDTEIKHPTNGTVAKEMNGYISSFGASIISAGLLPSVIFFSQKGDSAAERHKIILALEAILKVIYQDTSLQLLTKVKELYTAEDLNQAAISRLTAKIADAAIALKLAIRTFPKSSN